MVDVVDYSPKYLHIIRGQDYEAPLIADPPDDYKPKHRMMVNFSSGSTWHKENVMCPGNCRSVVAS